MSLRIRSFALVCVLTATACSERAPGPDETTAPAAPAVAAGEPAPPPASAATAVNPSTVPAVDTAGSQALLSPDETLQEVPMANAVDTAKVSGTVVGYKSGAWMVAASAGQTVAISFSGSNSNLMYNVWDVSAPEGGAIHRSEVDGLDAKLTAARTTTFLIRVGQPRATARRNEQGEYTLTVSRS